MADGGKGHRSRPRGALLKFEQALNHLKKLENLISLCDAARVDSVARPT
jgi:hypothetical protein